MSAVHSKDSGPEVLVRRFLWSKGMRYRLHVANVPGTPDIAVRRYKLAIFVHGCFWHGHEGCPKGRLPKSKLDYWSAKIDANRSRDKAVARQLSEEGWNQIVVWECRLRTRQSAATTLPKLWTDIRRICPDIGAH
jgi:DNA mismatch endonuclease (patch repair protein)